MHKLIKFSFVTTILFVIVTAGLYIFVRTQCAQAIRVGLGSDCVTTNAYYKYFGLSLISSGLFVFLSLLGALYLSFDILKRYAKKE